MKKKYSLKKLSILLAACLLLGSCPTGTYAAEASVEEPAIEQEQEKEEEPSEADSQIPASEETSQAPDNGQDADEQLPEGGSPESGLSGQETDDGSEQEKEPVYEQGAEQVTEPSVTEGDGENEELTESDEEITEEDSEEEETETGSVPSDPISSYSDFIKSLTELETYAREYADEHAGEDPNALVINFIRCGVEKYTSGTWTTFCGEEKTAFTTFVAEKDVENATEASRLRKLETFTLPNGDRVEFAHMFGCMDMAYHTGNQNTADLGSWVGDLCDLVQLAHNGGVSGTVEQMAEEIRTNNSKYFLYDDPHSHSFGRQDLYADLDAYYILRNLSGSGSISAVMKKYFTRNLTDKNRAVYFIEHRLGGASTRAEIRMKVYEIYQGNEGAHTLEGTYLPDGVNADVRQACCYAFADYLYETAKGSLENSYYTLISTEKSNPAPGVTQEIKTAVTQDNKQIVYYIAKADITRSDISVHANYNNNDGTSWGMSRVSDQMKAAEKRHSDPEDEEHYTPNYSAVIGVNADFYNMSTGVPSGPLVMEGIQYHDIGTGNFFGIKKDGTPIIGGKAEWDANKNDLVEAVGASVWLVRNGEIAVTATSNYYNDRASRTAVGITYDGRVVLMVLDGRQEPYSCGGSAIEIAQIMQDAGCVSAVNLDGGGSSTFAGKAEGSDEIKVINRPSDGYERSVSSSLMVVSAAKPSNEFDHAVISADYDYLTVGSELEIQAAGVTVTGGATDLPENTSLQSTDESIGTISEDSVFTAKAPGDVQIRVISGDGEVLGSKTMHVVDPTELHFSKESINAVYGEPVALPLEALYKGNPVKINPNDVTFGYLKVTLTSIGNVEGSAVNSTRTELVFDYPEAGTIDGFEFTPADGEDRLRTLTVGAVLTSKLNEFQQTIATEYQSAYQEAIANGFTASDAALQAEARAVNKALDTAARLSIYMYSADEATFDFEDATGENGIIAWKRDISNSTYNESEQTYSIIDPEQPAEAAYTFAVDMSKVPIPEELTGLLYMLPGGDQNGRTAWDFMLQLAERISPLTTVTVKVQIPEGFEADIRDLRLVNEYIEMTSAEVVGNELTVLCHFKEQSEPINPAAANPLCVLSGFRMSPAEDAVWDEDETLTAVLTGELSYDIYAHFHILKSLAQQEEYQTQYGLYPYDNSKNNPGDYGAHFMKDILDFEDSYKLDRSRRNGWARENGVWSYYEDGKALTGAHELPSPIDGEDGEYWYDFGTSGTCDGKLTGIFEYEGEHYYARLGLLVTGWQSIAADDGESYFYYFDKNDGRMYTGVRDVDSLTYTFNDEGQLIRGAFRTNKDGTKYFVAGESLFRRFITLEEGTYWLDVNGYVAHGNDHTVTTNVKDVTWYHFDEETGLLTGVCSGIFTYHDELYYSDENGKVVFGAVKVDDGIVFCGTLGKLYVNQSCYIDSSTPCYNCSLETGKYWCGEDGYIVSDGFVEIEGSTYYFSNYNRAKGFTKIGDDYYLFNSGNGKMYKNAKMWVPANSYGIEPGMHDFLEDGRMFVPDLENGKKAIINENGKLYFTVDGVKLTNGLNELDGEYYYAQNNGELVTGKTIWVSQKNGLIPEKGDYHYFDEEGKMLQTGFVTGGDGYTYYYQENVLALGFTKIGDDYYLFNAGSGKMYKNASMWVQANPYGVEPGMHDFLEDGRMFIPDLENGQKAIKEENGKLYFTVDGVKMTNGLNELDGEYYYAQSNGVLVTGKTIWVSQKNGLIPEKGDYHYFDEEGKMLQTGFVTGGDGYTYYYQENVLALGFTKVGDDYYLFNAGSGKMYKDGSYWVPANTYGVEPGMHRFDPDGIMLLD